MATSVDVYEFRCTRCYQSIQQSTDLAGSELPCPWCGQSTQAPEVTEDRILQATDSVLSPPPHAAPLPPAGSACQTVDELRNAAKLSAKDRSTTTRCSNPERMSASRLSRLVAFVIDVIVVSFASGLGVIPMIVLSVIDVIGRPAVQEYAKFMTYEVPMGILTKEWQSVEAFLARAGLEFWLAFAAAHSVLALVLLYQAYSVAKQGQSIGKKCMRIRIVNSFGEPPGFATGVLIRCCLVNFVGMLPLFYLTEWPAFFLNFLLIANVLAICLNPPRCIHDRIAGTYVVSA